MVSKASAADTFKEGVYKVADLNVSTNNQYTAQNISTDKKVYLEIFDENHVLLQSILLVPNSSKYTLLPLKPEYRITIVGDGNISIEPSS
jgi:hypothetical protein